MAHVAKVKSVGVAPMLGHYAREAERRGYERDNIDGSRTRLNYVISGSGREFSAVPNPDDLAARVRARISEAVESHEKVAGKALRKDANVMYDWVVTLPKDCPEDRARDFFAVAVGFIQDRYGAENVPGGFVHMDEATPHVHVPVVPVRGGKLVGAKVVNRTDLKTFHKDLSAAVDAALGFHVSIELDEAQKGVKQLSALSQDEYKAAKDELAAAKAEAAAARAEADEAQRRLECLQGAERQIVEGPGEAEAMRGADRAIADSRGVFAESAHALWSPGGWTGEGVPGRAASRERASKAQAGIERLRAALDSASERLGRVVDAVRAALTRLGGFVDARDLSDDTLRDARADGIEVREHRALTLDEQAAAARKWTMTRENLMPRSNRRRGTER